MRDKVWRLLNNKLFAPLLISFRVDSLFQSTNNYWTNYKINPGKSHQETAGYSHNEDVQEAVKNTHQLLQKVASAKIVTRATILDIGCGPGLYLADFGEDKKLFGIDLNKEMLSLAKRNVPNANFVQGDFVETQFVERFDLIYCVGMLQYIPMSKLETFIKKISSSLNNKGVLFISYPHAISKEDLKIPDVNYINYSPKYLNIIVSKYFKVISNAHVIDNRSIDDYDRTPYIPMNKQFDKTYKNSSILIAEKIA